MVQTGSGGSALPLEVPGLVFLKLVPDVFLPKQSFSKLGFSASCPGLRAPGPPYALPDPPHALDPQPHVRPWSSFCS